MSVSVSQILGVKHKLQVFYKGYWLGFLDEMWHDINFNAQDTALIGLLKLVNGNENGILALQAK